MSQDVGKLRCQIAQVPLYLIHPVQPPSKEVYVIVEKQGLNCFLFVDAQDMGKIYFCIVYLLYEHEKKLLSVWIFFFFFFFMSLFNAPVLFIKITCNFLFLLFQ
jgi:hypothetical protein